ncbi:MAG: hypothetical protein O7F69_13895, partial [Alphaproteobacteria bacterium]|nr:hypothetical protein [Alphaproteobacteria bacterium]
MKQSIIALALSMFAVGWTPAEAGTNQAISETVVDSTPALTRVAQLGQVTIYAPKRIDTDQETVDFTGKIEANGEISLTVNGSPVRVAADGSFLVRRTVPVGRSRLLLIAESSRGERAEHRVFVRRAAVGAKTDDFGDYYALIIGN